ncbi:DUF3810 domain-containing protein [Niabella aquatica]
MTQRVTIKRLSWAILLVFAIGIKIISFHSAWVEEYYTYGIYPFIAIVLRYLFGWLPFSAGDILYTALVIWAIHRVLTVIKHAKIQRYSRSYMLRTLRRTVFVWLLVYVLFYSLWGLNYSRAGIASQLGLKEQQYSAKDLDTLVHLLRDRVNDYAKQLTPATRDSFKTKKNLFSNASLLYNIAGEKYPFLAYKGYSVKPSLFSYLGNYMGFQGYYNPFTGEAQVNTTIPPSVEPFVAAHEIAHQLGYAKESEANFVGFLSCRLHPSVHFRYSVYFDMYHYAIRELAYIDSAKANAYDSTLHMQVKKDKADYIAFYKKYQNPAEPYIDKFYGYFLKANNQPRGRQSYNDVVIWLIAYYKKLGTEAI